MIPRRRKICIRICFALFFIFLALFLAVSKLESLKYFLTLDTRIASVAAYFYFPELIKFFIAVTSLGDWQFVFPFAILITLIFLKLKRYYYIETLVFTIGGAQISDTLLKIIFQKPRPDLALIFLNSYSFPSGHTVLSIAFYGFFIYLAFVNFKSKFLKLFILIFGAILVTLIGYSRIYLNVHFYSDVVAGYFLGWIWLSLGVLWLNYLELGTKNKIIAPLLGVGTIALCSLFFLSLPTPKIAGPTNIIITNNILYAFNKKEGLPKFTEKLDGSNQHPLSFLIVAKNDSDLIQKFKASGWLLADRFNFKTIEKLYETGRDNKPYPTGPVTPSFWSDKTQDFSFEKPTVQNTIRVRHHCRFWETNIRTEDGSTLYIGYANFDEGTKWLITHKVAPDMDKERESLFADLLKTRSIKDYQKIQFNPPTKGYSYSGDFFYTDGEAYVIYFR